MAEDNINNNNNLPEPTENPEDIKEAEALAKNSSNYGELVKQAKKKPSLKKLVEQIEKRDLRKSTLQLRLKGLTVREIAHAQARDVKAVMVDLMAVRQDLREDIGRYQQDELVGEALAVYDDIITKSWRQFELTPDNRGSTKHKFLDLVRVVENDKIKLLEDIGIINAAPVQTETKVTFDIPWDDATKQTVALALIQKSLTSSLPEPTPEGDGNSENIIDITPVSDQD